MEPEKPGPEDEIRKHDEQLLNKFLRDILTHFDTVQIFVTRQEGESTMAYSDGKGNWYARYGQIGEWIQNGGAMHASDPHEEG